MKRYGMNSATNSRSNLAAGGVIDIQHERKKVIEPTVEEALARLNKEDLSRLRENVNQYAREVAKCVMILLYFEKEHHQWNFFQDKLRNPDDFISKIRSWNRKAVPWELDLIRNTVSESWFNWENIKFYSMEVTANLAVWVKDKYNKGVEYLKIKEEREATKASRARGKAETITRDMVKHKVELANFVEKKKDIYNPETKNEKWTGIKKVNKVYKT